MKRLNTHTTGHLIRSASLNGYIELVQSLERNPHTFMRTVGLKADDLLDPEALISRDAARELLEITARATRIEDFALRLAAQRKLSALGPISLVLREEPTLRHALNTLCKYLKLVNPSLMLHVEDADDLVIIREELLPTPGLAMRQSVELAVSSMFKMLSELAGPQWQAHGVYFTHRPPAELAAHRKFFGQTVKFNQAFNGLVCLASDLAKPRESSDKLAAGFARKYLETELKKRAHSSQETCYQVILALLPSGDCTATAVARLMNRDRRTLHRQLSADGLGFAELLDRVRMDAVKRHLQESDLSLQEISALLGFALPSSMNHWFQANFGCSPSRWKRCEGQG